MSTDIDCIVVGAGVIGLAIARALALSGREVMVVEAAEGIGTGTSARNSEVIHAGIYYPAGSLKAKLCVEGRKMLYAYCAEKGVAHKRIGKLIVATSQDEIAKLDDILGKARINGVDDMELLSAAQAQALEPALFCTAALHSPSTGIIDSHGLMLAYQGDAENAGAQCVFHTPLLSGEVRREGGFTLQFGGSDAMQLSCNVLINASGLHAPTLARTIRGIPPASIPTEYLCKGSYFTLQGKAPFTRLIYPTPHHAGLGVHLTLDLGGQAKFGPDRAGLIETRGEGRIFPAGDGVGVLRVEAGGLSTILPVEVKDSSKVEPVSFTHQVVPVLTRMTPEGYAVEILPAWRDFPGADPVADAALMNQRLEHYIDAMPDQYYWVHRRFKSRPPGAAPVY